MSRGVVVAWSSLPHFRMRGAVLNFRKLEGGLGSARKCRGVAAGHASGSSTNSAAGLISFSLRTTATRPCISDGIEVCRLRGCNPAENAARMQSNTCWNWRHELLIRSPPREHQMDALRVSCFEHRRTIAKLLSHMIATVTHGPPGKPPRGLLP